MVSSLASSNCDSYADSGERTLGEELSKLRSAATSVCSAGMSAQSGPGAAVQKELVNAER